MSGGQGVVLSETFLQGECVVPTRIIRDGILTSERINALSSHAELFYRRLMSVADDHGRYSANPTLLRASCYPLKLDSVKEDSIKKHLAECVGVGLIVLYTVDGKHFLRMVDFGQRVNGKSKFPEPPNEAAGVSPEIPEISRLDVDVDVDVDEGDTPPKKPGGTSAVELQTWIDECKAKGDKPIPDDDPLFAYAEKVGLPRDYLALAWGWFKAAMQGKRKKDWRAHFRNAVKGNWPRYWRQDGDGWALTVAGVQAQREAQA